MNVIKIQEYVQYTCLSTTPLGESDALLCSEHVFIFKSDNAIEATLQAQLIRRVRSNVNCSSSTFIKVDLGFEGMQLNFQKFASP